MLCYSEKSFGRVGDWLVVEKDSHRRTYLVIILTFLNAVDEDSQEHPGNGNAGYHQNDYDAHTLF